VAAADHDDVVVHGVAKSGFGRPYRNLPVTVKTNVGSKEKSVRDKEALCWISSAYWALLYDLAVMVALITQRR
jgi:hypothetical protein